MRLLVLGLVAVALAAGGFGQRQRTFINEADSGPLLTGLR